MVIDAQESVHSRSAHSDAAVRAVRSAVDRLAAWVIAGVGLTVAAQNSNASGVGTGVRRIVNDRRQESESGVFDVLFSTHGLTASRTDFLVSSYF